MFDELPRNHYGAILADPPWPFGKGRLGRERGYPIMKEKEISQLPVSNLALPNSLLFMWARTRHLPMALRVMSAWGFEYLTVGLVWIKMNKSGQPSFGIGYWTRNSAELCLLGKRGRPQRLAHNVQQTVLSPRREHSRKPDEQYEHIEQMVGGPYLELFSRYTRPDWDSWGLEKDKFNLI